MKLDRPYAHRLFTEIGASGHAERLLDERAAVSWELVLLYRDDAREQHHTMRACRPDSAFAWI